MEQCPHTRTMVYSPSLRRFAFRGSALCCHPIVRQAQDLLPDYFDRGELKADVDEQEVPADDGGLA